MRVEGGLFREHDPLVNHVNCFVRVGSPFSHEQHHGRTLQPIRVRRESVRDGNPRAMPPSISVPGLVHEGFGLFSPAWRHGVFYAHVPIRGRVVGTIRLKENAAGAGGAFGRGTYGR